MTQRSGANDTSKPDDLCCELVDADSDGIVLFVSNARTAGRHFDPATMWVLSFIGRIPARESRCRTISESGSAVFLADIRSMTQQPLHHRRYLRAQP